MANISILYFLETFSSYIVLPSSICTEGKFLSMSVLKQILNNMYVNTNDKTTDLDWY